ncbi:hypothetical protein FRC09_016680, partial [Ceratobasidium sp. 395]
TERSCSTTWSSPRCSSARRHVDLTQQPMMNPVLFWPSNTSTKPLFFRLTPARVGSTLCPQPHLRVV